VHFVGLFFLQSSTAIMYKIPTHARFVQHCIILACWFH